MSAKELYDTAYALDGELVEAVLADRENRDLVEAWLEMAHVMIPLRRLLVA